MSKMTKEDVLELADREGVKFIRLQFSDILGTVKKRCNYN